jgi:GTP cyclohydrolase II
MLSPNLPASRVTRIAEASLPTRCGLFRIAIYRQLETGEEATVLYCGSIEGRRPMLVRLHSECLTGDTLGSLRCDCGEQLDASLAMLAAHGRGILFYLKQEGRGIGLADKVRAYALQDEGLDTVDANRALGLPVDGRSYELAADILHHLGLNRIRLVTNNPTKRRALELLGIRVVERVPLEVKPNPVNHRYLRTKMERMGHMLNLPPPSAEC